MNNVELRVAVASQEGVAISEHFGHAKVFYIYDATTAVCRFVEKREVINTISSAAIRTKVRWRILLQPSTIARRCSSRKSAMRRRKSSVRGIREVTDYTWEEIEPSLVGYMSRQGAGPLTDFSLI